MSTIIAKYYNLPIYTIKYTFKHRIFKLDDIRGSIIDEIRDIGRFDSVAVDPAAIGNFQLIQNAENQNTDYPLIVLENVKATKILVVEPSFIKFQSAIGDNYPSIAASYIDLIFKKIGYTPDCASLGIAITYVYTLDKENLSILWDKFNCYKDLNLTNEMILSDKLDEFSYQNVYRNEDEDYIIKIILNKSQKVKGKPNCQIYIDTIIKNNIIENKEKKIKESLKFSINIINDIGISVK